MRRPMITNAISELGKPMYEVHGFTANVMHSVELDGFPSQWRGPVLAVYCYDRGGNVRVEPRWLTPAGVGVHRGPQFSLNWLKDEVDEIPAWFAENEIPFHLWRQFAIASAPS